MATPAAFIRSALKREDSLFLLIYKFNNAIAGYVDWSHLPELSQLEPIINASSKGLNDFSVYLKSRFRFQDDVYGEFHEPRLRLALMESQTLDRLVVYAGAALYSEKVNKVIMKEKLEALKSAIGEDAYFFVTKRATLLSTLMPRVPLNDGVQIPSKDDVYKAGKHCLEICLSGESEAIVERLRLKFPKTMSLDFAQDVSPEQRMKAWNYLFRILVKEVKPEVGLCFT